MADAPFSLLLPVYGGDVPEHVTSAFRSSVDEQTRQPAEVVIVRDGPVSHDLEDALASLAAASPVPVNRVNLEANMGLATALERGLDAVAHDVVARMDADDLSLPPRFARQVARMDEGLDLIGSGLVEFHGDLTHVVRSRIPPTGAAIAPFARFHSPFNHPTVVFRRSAVRSAGGFQPLGRMEDYWLWARMIHGGARVDNVAEPLLGYRVDAGAYERRGGLEMLRSEVAVQRAFRSIGFTTRAEYARNIVVRGGYRLVPTVVRRNLYRRVFGSKQQ
ncbi:glycosyltransferase [Demequina pelophila]|uniref:glycosyltransferase n=1 Tax=Demequina pelophila TaxID=1638984 RepID=UPI0007849A5E|nr:glycosyltransferase [Demequina pelophila]